MSDTPHLPPMRPVTIETEDIVIGHAFSAMRMPPEGRADLEMARGMAPGVNSGLRFLIMHTVTENGREDSAPILVPIALPLEGLGFMIGQMTACLTEEEREQVKDIAAAAAQHAAQHPGWVEPRTGEPLTDEQIRNGLLGDG